MQKYHTDNIQTSIWLECSNAIVTCAVVLLYLSSFESTLFMVALQIIMDNFIVVYAAVAEGIEWIQSSRNEATWGANQLISSMIRATWWITQLPLQEKLHLTALSIFYASRQITTLCTSRFGVPAKTIKMGISMLTWASCVIHTANTALKSVRTKPLVVGLNLSSLMIVSRMRIRMNWSYMNQIPNISFATSQQVANYCTAVGLTMSMQHQATEHNQRHGEETLERKAVESSRAINTNKDKHSQNLSAS